MEIRTLEELRADPRSLIKPLAYAIACFFIWGLAYGLLDVLNKHFQETLNVGKAQSTWLQMAYFGAYLSMSLPSGLVMQRYGYKAGLLTGLLTTALGAILFVPAAQIESFPFFVAAMFVFATGLCCVEIVVETYVNCLGAPEHASRRLNLAQSFSGLGSFMGPLIGGSVFFSPAVTHALGGPHRSIQATYAIIAVGVLIFSAAIGRAALPEIADAHADAGLENGHSIAPPLYRQRHFVLAIATQVLYVGAQVGTGAFFINFITETWVGFSSQQASFLLSVALLLYIGGRFLTTALMTKISPRTLLIVYGFSSFVLTLVASAGVGHISALALVIDFFFMGPMLATIYGLGLKGLGPATKRGSSIMVMAIGGGGLLLPYPMGRIAETYGTPAAFLLPAICLGLVALYGWKGVRR